MTPKIYIASPYSIGDQHANVLRQIQAANLLLDAGYAVHVPLLCHYLDVVQPRLYVEWIRHDLQWLACCDVLLRLPGESQGADMEVREAERLGIRVVYDIEELLKSKP